MKKTIKQEKLYPILWNEKKWYEKDCDDVFTSFYTCKLAMRKDGAVYVFEGSWIYPDGTYNHKDSRT